MPLAPQSCRQELKEGLWSGGGKEGSVDHCAAPFLAVRRGDANPQSPHLSHRIRLMRIGTADVETPHDRILPLLEDARLRECRALAIRIKGSREADALGVVSPMPQRRAGG